MSALSVYGCVYNMYMCAVCTCTYVWMCVQHVHVCVHAHVCGVYMYMCVVCTTCTCVWCVQHVCGVYMCVVCICTCACGGGLNECTKCIWMCVQHVHVCGVYMYMCAVCTCTCVQCVHVHVCGCVYNMYMCVVCTCTRARGGPHLQLLDSPGSPMRVQVVHKGTVTLTQDPQRFHFTTPTHVHKRTRCHIVIIINGNTSV